MTDAATRTTAATPRAWWAAAAGLAVACLLPAVTAGTALGSVTYVVVALGCTTAFLVVVRRRGLQPLSAWSTLGGGLLLMAVGDAVYDLPSQPEIGRTGLIPADPVYVVASVVMLVGALRLKGAHAGERDREASIDAASIGLAAAILFWHPLVEPRFGVEGVPLLSRLVTASYPVLDVVVLAMVCWLALTSRRWTAATALLVLAAVTFLVADVAYSLRLDHGALQDPALGWLDSLWLVAFAGYLLAVLHPTASEIGRSAPVEGRSISRGRLLLSGAALLAPITAVALSDAALHHLLMAVVVEAVLVALVLVRLADLAAGERRARQALLDRERYFRSLVQNSSEAVVVLDVDGMVHDASPAVRTLLGVEPEALVGRRLSRSVAGLDPAAMDALLLAAATGPDEVVSGDLAIGAATGVRWLEMRTTDLLGEPAVSGLVVNLHDVTDRHQVQDELERRALTDGLTGLANRVLFLDRLAQAHRRRQPPELAVVYLDLDRFKEVNDRYGHADGDQLLQAVAARLSSAVRPEDTVARLGGDEFAVLVQGPAAGTVARGVARRIVEAMRTPVPLPGARIVAPVSAGVADTRQVGSGADALLRAADAAMYRAKRAGGDRVVVWALDGPAAPADAPLAGRR
jgi:diguanylate cyclase (GGDEF)-like protein/PAS domain S-box-containing protein